MTQFAAANAQVVGISTEDAVTLETFSRANKITHPLLSDAARTMLLAYGALVTDAGSPMYRLPKRAYFIVNRQGIVRYARIQADPLDFVNPEEVLKALRALKD